MKFGLNDILQKRGISGKINDFKKLQKAFTFIFEKTFLLYNTFFFKYLLIK